MIHFIQTDQHVFQLEKIVRIDIHNDAKYQISVEVHQEGMEPIRLDSVDSQQLMRGIEMMSHGRSEVRTVYTAQAKAVPA